MKNIEQKFRCDDVDRAIHSAVALGATFRTDLMQRDVYFRVPSGRLKLRTVRQGSATRAELIAYERVDGDRCRVSEYAICRIGQPAALEAALRLVPGIRGIVEKRRRLLTDANLRLHFDDVTGLGDFVEFEAVLGAHDDAQVVVDAHERIARWVERLGLTRSVAGAYIDLIERGEGVA